MKYIIMIGMIVGLFGQEVKAQNRVDYIDYYNLIYKAEHNCQRVNTTPSMKKMFYEEGRRWYKKAFQKAPGKKNHLLQAAFVVGFLQDTLLAQQYLQKAFLAGLTLEELHAKDEDATYAQTTWLKQAVKNYPQLQARYQTKRSQQQKWEQEILNSVLLKNWEKYKFTEQAKSAAIRQRYLVEKETLQQGVYTKGFPKFTHSEDNIKFIMILTDFFKDEDYFLVLLKEVRQGRLSPRDYAVMIDLHTYQLDRKTVYGELKYASRDAGKNEERKKIGLRPFK